MILAYPVNLELILLEWIEFGNETINVTLPVPAVSARPNTICFDSPLFRPAPDGVGMGVQDLSDIFYLEHFVQWVISNHAPPLSYPFTII